MLVSTPGLPVSGQDPMVSCHEKGATPPLDGASSVSMATAQNHAGRQRGDEQQGPQWQVLVVAGQQQVLQEVGHDRIPDFLRMKKSVRFCLATLMPS